MISLHTPLSRFLKTYIRRDTPSFVYVAMGDSAAEGRGATSPMRSYPGIIYRYLDKQNKQVTFHNLGKRKSPASWIIKEQLEKTILLNPDLITISVGANDIRVRNMPWNFEKELTYIIRELKEKTHARIVINTVPDFSHVHFIPFIIKPVAKAIIQQYNSVIEKVAKKENIIFVDLFDQTHIFAKAYPEAIAADRFHPSDFGYALWANSILGELKKSLAL